MLKGISLFLCVVGYVFYIKKAPTFADAIIKCKQLCLCGKTFRCYCFDIEPPELDEMFTIVGDPEYLICPPLEALAFNPEPVLTLMLAPLDASA